MGDINVVTSLYDQLHVYDQFHPWQCFFTPFYIPHEFWALSFRFNQMVKSFFSTTYFPFFSAKLQFYLFQFLFFSCPLFPPSTLFSFYLSYVYLESVPPLPCLALPRHLQAPHVHIYSKKKRKKETRLFFTLHSPQYQTGMGRAWVM